MSLQEISAKGALSRPRRINNRPNKIMRAHRSFGIMPAPGMARRPVGRSPDTAQTISPTTITTAPATWSLRRVTARTSCGNSALDLADLADRRLDALDVGVPELLEGRPVQIV